MRETFVLSLHSRDYPGKHNRMRQYLWIYLYTIVFPFNAKGDDEIYAGGHGVKWTSMWSDEWINDERTWW